MPERILEKFNIRRLEILNEKGEADEALMPALSGEQIKRMYELMVLSRLFDSRALNLQREGRLGTYPPIIGQEASQVGSALALEKTDWVIPSYRETAVFIALGYPLPLLFQYWAGDERGLRIPEDLNIFPIAIPVGTQIPHGTGAALAAKYRGDKIAVIAYVGDGGTSKGDFHEGLNFAGVFKVPLVVICQNNQWAISLPRVRQSASRTLAQKALAYGIEGLQVDGNDIFAVYKAATSALAKARGGEGPSFIECFTYRMADHTTADDAGRYRTKEEVEAWKPKDPILRLKLFMEKKGLWNQKYQQEIEQKFKISIDEAVKTAESFEPPSPVDMFTHTYGELTLRQLKQMRDFENAYAQYGAGHKSGPERGNAPR